MRRGTREILRVSAERPPLYESGTDKNSAPLLGQGLNPRVSELVAMLRKLEAELEVELATLRIEQAFTVRGRAVQFEERVLQRHRKLKTGVVRYILGSRPLLLVVAPVVYAPLLAFLILDGLVTIYQAACFPVFGIAPVRRRDYLIFDRFQLRYLNVIERVNCLYCSYANGLLAYVREIASRTEQYWCPIKHARRIIGTHGRYAAFMDYGDAESYHQGLAELRRRLQAPGEPKI